MAHDIDGRSAHDASVTYSRSTLKNRNGATVLLMGYASIVTTPNGSTVITLPFDVKVAIADSGRNVDGVIGAATPSRGAALHTIGDAPGTIGLSALVQGF